MPDNIGRYLTSNIGFKSDIGRPLESMFTSLWWVLFLWNYVHCNVMRL